MYKFIQRKQLISEFDLISKWINTENNIDCKSELQKETYDNVYIKL